MNDQPDQKPTGKQIEVVTSEGEVVLGTALNALPDGYDQATETLAVSLMRAEVDQQIATARAIPRSITRAVQNIITLATLDEEAAEECIYALPRAGKEIRGPSVRLAEIVASQYGNCRVGTRVVHVDRFEKYIEAEGIFHDLETNYATTARVRRRISDKKGKLLSEDMIIVTGNAACAIAKRNAILGGTPRAIWMKGYREVERVIAGDAQTLASRRDKAIKSFALYGVTPEQVFQAIGVSGMDDIKTDHLPTLRGMFAALKSGESNVEEMFPKTEKIAAGKQTIADKLDAVANGGGDKNGEAGTASSPKAAASDGGQPEAAAQSTKSAAIADGGSRAPSEQETKSAIEKSGDTAEKAADRVVAADLDAKAAAVEKALEADAAPAAATTAPKQENSQATAQASAQGNIRPTQSTGGEAASSTGATTQTTAAKTVLSQAVKTGLRRMSDDMMSAMSKKKIENIFKAAVEGNEIKQLDPETAHIYNAADTIKKAHEKRVAGDSSPSECDQVVRGVLA